MGGHDSPPLTIALLNTYFLACSNGCSIDFIEPPELLYRRFIASCNLRKGITVTHGNAFTSFATNLFCSFLVFSITSASIFPRHNRFASLYDRHGFIHVYFISSYRHHFGLIGINGVFVINKGTDFCYGKPQSRGRCVAVDDVATILWVQRT